MLPKIFKLGFTSLVTLVISALFGYADLLVRHEWTKASMLQVTQNMGDQIGIKNQMNLWNIAIVVVWALGALCILGLWYLMYRKTVKKFIQTLATMAVPVIALFLLAGCGFIPDQRTVIVTPPDYAIVIDLANPDNQAVGNSFMDGELMNVTQVAITMSKCSANSVDRCPDKLVATVPGAPESRIYTEDPNTGTAGANQALCFEATGSNGCIDFSVGAIVKREDAKCYANLVGVRPIDDEEGKPSRFAFRALPLSEALDTRVVQIAGAAFAREVANVSPLALSTDKFELFENVHDEIVGTVFEKTCISITELELNGGVNWTSPAVQAQIDEATIVRNKTQLVAQQNALLAIQAQGTISRTQAYEEAFGIEAAVRLEQIAKWDGSGYLPLLPSTQSAPAIQATQTISQ